MNISIPIEVTVTFQGKEYTAAEFKAFVKSQVADLEEWKKLALYWERQFEHLRAENERLKARKCSHGPYEMYGTDGCHECDHGRIEMYRLDKLCVECRHKKGSKG